MQPTYLPWLGYIALMQQADVFVLLDDVPFSYQSWQHRNRIRAGSSWQWLTVPVRKRGTQRINEVLIDNDQPWPRKHVQSILQNYARAPWLAEHRAWIESAYARPPRLLCELNVSLITELARRLDVDTPLRSAAALQASGDRVGRLIAICRELGADEYLSPLGAFEYIEADNQFLEAGIQLGYQHFEHPVYRQPSAEFVPQLSALDLLLNEGPASRGILAGGTREPYTPDAVRSLRNPG